MGADHCPGPHLAQISLFLALGGLLLGVTSTGGHCFPGNNPLKVSPPATLTAPTYLTAFSTLQGATVEDTVQI